MQSRRAVRTLIPTALFALLMVVEVNARAEMNQAAPKPALIAFEMPDGIHLINSDGSGERKLVGTLPGDQNPRWSPDGRKVLFWNDRDAGGDIYVLDVQSGRRRALTSDTDRSSEYPSWSPHGDLIAFERILGHATHIYVMRKDGTGIRPLTTGRYQGYSPQWSPDGRKVVFTALWPETGLAIVNVDGTGLRPLRSVSNEDWGPAWSPDGTTIAFNSDAVGKTEIYAVNADGAEIRRLTWNEVVDFDPVWSPDGKQILFTTGRTGLWEVYRMNADGTAQKRVTRAPRQYACCGDRRP